MKRQKEVIKIDGEVINLKKDFMGWRVIYPIKNPDDSFNWFNFLTGGSWGKLIVLLFVLAIIFFIIFAYKHDTAFCRELIANGSQIVKQSEYLIPPRLP